MDFNSYNESWKRSRGHLGFTKKESEIDPREVFSQSHDLSDRPEAPNSPVILLCLVSPSSEGQVKV